jgi:hypothetical protein
MTNGFDKSIVDVVMKYHRSGSKYCFRYLNPNQQRLKIKFGPGKVLSRRFEVDNQTAEAIKLQLRRSRKSCKGVAPNLQESNRIQFD